MPGIGAPVDSDTLQKLKDVANRLRIHSIKSTNVSKCGHPTSCVSIAEIMSVLFFHTMRYKVQIPKDASSDRFILSKGHAAPILYAAWAEAGLFPVEDLNNLHQIDSDLEGHPTPRLSFVDVATGSLGQGLSVAAGMAYTGKYIDKASYRVYCVIGDGESAEGSIWEALSFAGYYKLDNLVAIFDVNRLGQSEPTPFQHQMDVYKNRLEAFGCNTYVIDGHDVEAICKALDDASQLKDKPTAIVAKTYKGKGIPGIENVDNWHGKVLGDEAVSAIEAITRTIVHEENTLFGPQKPPQDDAASSNNSNIKLATPPNYKLGEKITTRLAYGTALVKLGQNNDRVVAIDGDTKSSTCAYKFGEDFPDRFIQCYIAEQNMVGIAIGCGCRSRTVPFCSTFAAFFTRAFDQLRMAAISQANIKCVGSHAGISVELFVRNHRARVDVLVRNSTTNCEDGPSQMALEDIAMFRAIPTATVFYPSDAVSTERACELAANICGICFIRTSRPKTAVIYPNEENFEIGKCKLLRQSDQDQALVVGAGVTLHEAIAAADILAKEGVNISVMDPFTIKPIDEDCIRDCTKRCHGRVITVEDHYPEGGIGDAVASALSMTRNVIHRRLAVQSIPRSGPPKALMDMFGISAKSIVKAVHELITI